MSKLRVTDEINEALRYYDASLFDVVPALERDLERARRRALGRRRRRHPRRADGVVDRRRPRRQPVRHRRRAAHRRRSRAVARPRSTTTSAELRRLSRRLSMSARLVTPTAELLALADASRRRVAVPRRRAVPPGAARHVRPALRAGRRAPRRRRRRRADGAAAAGPAAAVRAASTSSSPTSTLVADVAALATARRRSPTPWSSPSAAPSSRSALHLCGLDMRQNAAVHERRRRRAAARSPASAPTTSPSTRPARLAVLRAELSLAAPPAQPVRHVRRAHDRASSTCSTRRPTAVARLGADAIPHYVISGADVGQRRARGRRAAPRGRARAARPSRRRARSTSCRCSRRSTTSTAATRCSPRCSTTRATHARRRPRRPPGGDDRLLRLEQGRRLPGRQLGAVGGPGPPRRRGPVPRRAPAAVPRSRRHRRARRRSGVRGDPRPAAGSVDGQLRITEQGEMVAAKYASRRRPGATSRSSSPPRSRRRPASTGTSAATTGPFDRRRWRRSPTPPSRPTARSSTTSRRFVEFFARDHADPARSPRSTSAAARRRGPAPGRIQDLRAIPWVFGWTQCRLMLPGWYGSGAAFEALAGADAERRRRCCGGCTSAGRSSARVIGNMGMVLAKADIGIGAMYADALVADDVLRRRILERIVAEHAPHVDVARPDHRLGRPARRQPDAGPQHPQPLPVPRPAARDAGRAAAPPPRRRPRRARRARHPAHAQRHRHRPAQQRLS